MQRKVFIHLALLAFVFAVQPFAFGAAQYGTITVDGVVSPGEWDFAQLEFDTGIRDAALHDSKDALGVKGWFAWDDTRLYGRIDGYPATRDGYNGPLSDVLMVIYINAEGWPPAYQFHAFTDGDLDGNGAEAAYSSDFMRIEFSIPHEEIVDRSADPDIRFDPRAHFLEWRISIDEGFSSRSSEEWVIEPPETGNRWRRLDFEENPQPGTIGDTVWADADGDGQQSTDEAGIPGVLVSLRDASGTIIDSETTDSDGHYLFDQLPAGTYTVDVDESTLDNRNLLTTDNEPLTLNLGAGEDFLDVDFGYRYVKPDDLCESYGKPRALTMLYTGEGEDALSHDQDEGKIEVIGDPGFANPVYIVASSKRDLDDKKAAIWFEGEVWINGTFTIDAANGGEDKLKSKTYVHILDGDDNLLQLVRFHTSCSQPLREDDQFGSLVLTHFTPEGEEPPADDNGSDDTGDNGGDNGSDNGDDQPGDGVQMQLTDTQGEGVATATVGDVVEVQVWLKNAEDVNGVSFYLDHDGGVLKVLDTDETSGMQPFASTDLLQGEVLENVESSNALRYTEVDTQASVSGDGILATLRFEVVALNSDGETRIYFLSEESDRRVTRVSTTAGALEPETEGITIRFVGSQPGDANGDGMVDLVDFSILAAAFGSDDTRADFNSDGGVDLADFSIFAAHFGEMLPMAAPAYRQAEAGLLWLEAESRGDQIEVQLRTSEPVQAVGFRLDLDERILQWTSQGITEGELFQNPLLAHQDGQVFLAERSRSVANRGVVATLHLSATDAAYGDQTVVLQDAQVVLPDGSLLRLPDLRATVRTRPEANRLLANYPNPFNPETWIPFELAESANVRVRIYDLPGRLVRTLELGNRTAGRYMGRSQAVYWDGRNDAGERVASGIYLYQLQVGDFTSIRRMVIAQ